MLFSTCHYISTCRLRDWDFLLFVGPTLSEGGEGGRRFWRAIRALSWREHGLSRRAVDITVKSCHAAELSLTWHANLRALAPHYLLYQSAECTATIRYCIDLSNPNYWFTLDSHYERVKYRYIVTNYQLHVLVNNKYQQLLVISI